MNILILGGHGFIGHHTARQLVDQGHSISVIDLHHRYGDYQEWEYNTVLQQRLTYMGAHAAYFGNVADQEFMDGVFASGQFDVVLDQCD